MNVSLHKAGVGGASDALAAETAAADAPSPDSPEVLIGELRVDPLELALVPSGTAGRPAP